MPQTDTRGRKSFGSRGREFARNKNFRVIDHRLEHLPVDGPWPIDAHALVDDLDHRRLEADRGWAAIEHSLNSTVEIRQHVIGCRRTGMAKGIRAWRRNRNAGLPNQL